MHIGLAYFKEMLNVNYQGFPGFWLSGPVFSPFCITVHLGFLFCHCCGFILIVTFVEPTLGFSDKGLAISSNK